MTANTLAKNPAKSVFTDPFTAVDIEEIAVAGETVPSRIAVRVKDDAGQFQVQAFLSKGYQLLPNRKVRDIADDIMSRTPEVYGGFKNLKTLWDGKRYVDFFASNNPVTQVRNGTTIDLHVGLMAWNAYDGTRAVGFEVFALNPFCTNQYQSRNRFGFFKWRHSGDEVGRIDVDDALNNISAGVQNIIAVAPRIAEMKHQPLTSRLLVDARTKIESFPKTKWGDVLAKLATEEDNRFGLYQAMTNIISHEMSGLSSINTGSDVTEYMLDVEAKAVLNHTTAEAAINHG